MSVPVTLDDTERGFLAQFQEARKNLPGAGTPWVASLREAGMRSFETLGLPHARVEEWKYTDIKRALRQAYALSDPAEGAILREDLTQDPFEGLDAYVMVFVDGYFRRDLSRLDGLPDGVELISLRDALETPSDWLQEHLGTAGEASHHAVNGLNLALMQDGAVLRIAENITVQKPIWLMYLSTKAMAGHAAHTRSLIVAEKGARAVLLESHTGHDETDRITTIGTGISVGDGATIHHVKAQGDGRNALHLASAQAHLGEGARYETFAMTTGGRLTRNDVMVRFGAPNGFARVSGAALLVETQHCDNTTVIDHALPDCESHELFKNVLGDKARAVFQGKVIVRQDAQRTDGYQLCQTLLLSEGAEIDTKPELEIYADDVKCSHGATVGDLDSESIFYLRSRGIPEPQAKALLVEAFVAQALEDVPFEPAREALSAHVSAWLAENSARIGAAVSGHLDEGDDDGF